MEQLKINTQGDANRYSYSLHLTIHQQLLTQPSSNPPLDPPLGGLHFPLVNLYYWQNTSICEPHRVEQITAGRQFDQLTRYQIEIKGELNGMVVELVRCHDGHPIYKDETLLAGRKLPLAMGNDFAGIVIQVGQTRAKNYYYRFIVLSSNVSEGERIWLKSHLP
jgi:hypothetical protein